MHAQQGTFTICQDIMADHGEAMIEILPATENLTDNKVAVHRARFTVPAKRKPAFLKRLYQLNVTAATLFPGLDGLGAEIEESVRLVDAEAL